MADSYIDDKLYQSAKRAAQDAANATGKSMVLGYENYSGWCHVVASDKNAIAELGDAVIIEPILASCYE